MHRWRQYRDKQSHSIAALPAVAPTDRMNEWIHSNFYLCFLVIRRRHRRRRHQHLCRRDYASSCVFCFTISIKIEIATWSPFEWLAQNDISINTIYGRASSNLIVFTHCHTVAARSFLSLSHCAHNNTWFFLCMCRVPPVMALTAMMRIAQS